MPDLRRGSGVGGRGPGAVSTFPSRNLDPHLDPWAPPALSLAPTSGPEEGNVVCYEKLRSAVLGIMLLLSAGNALAAEDEAGGLKVPRFVSLDADKVNLRTGPGQRYPIDWVLTRRDMPVEVIAQFENWRRIREWTERPAGRSRTC